MTHPNLENVNLAELWRTAPADVGESPVGEDGHVIKEYLWAGYIVRFNDEGPTYAWIFGRRIGPFMDDRSARRAIQERMKALCVAGITFEVADA